VAKVMTNNPYKYLMILPSSVVGLPEKEAIDLLNQIKQEMERG
jgi:hypothetical protein